MVDTPALNERLLEVALQRSLDGFQAALKRTLELFKLTAWAIVFPPSTGIDGRPVFIAHGVRAGRGPLLATAAKDGLRSLFPPGGPDSRTLTALAREMAPASTDRCRIVRSRREKDLEIFLFCFRQSQGQDLEPGELGLLSEVSRVFDRCFVTLAEDQEQQFEAGLFRIIGNLHPEGLCLLDSRHRVLFENRNFREQMHLWNHGLQGAQSLSLPKQSELPAIWREACNRSFQAFREVKLPPNSGKMVVTQGSLLSLKQPLDAGRWIEGAVRYLSFQSAFGIRRYLLLTSAIHRRQVEPGEMTLGRIAARLGFSRRETELAALILRGSSASEIASRLKIAIPTVKTHIRHILHKSGVRNRLQFVALCRAQD